LVPVLVDLVLEQKAAVVEGVRLVQAMGQLVILVIQVALLCQEALLVPAGLVVVPLVEVHARVEALLEAQVVAALVVEEVLAVIDKLIVYLF